MLYDLILFCDILESLNKAFNHGEDVNVVSFSIIGAMIFFFENT